MLSFITKARVCSTKHLPEMLSHDLDLKMFFLSRNQFNQKWWQNIEILVLCLAHRVSSLLATNCPWRAMAKVMKSEGNASRQKKVVEHSFSFSVSLSAEEKKKHGKCSDKYLPEDHCTKSYRFHLFYIICSFFLSEKGQLYTETFF